MDSVRFNIILRDEETKKHKIGENKFRKTMPYSCLFMRKEANYEE